MFTVLYLYFQMQCPDIPWQECIEMKVEDDCAITPIVQMFQVLQSGLVFVAVVSGVISLFHLLTYRFWRCGNSATFTAILMIGLCHLISCIYLLKMAENKGDSGGIPGCSSSGCLDYYAVSTIANSLVIAIILCNVIRNSCSTQSRGFVYCLCYTFPVFTGLYMAVHKPWDTVDQYLQNDSLMTLGQQNQTHLDVFLAVCPTSVSSDRFRLWYEYSLIYLPGVIVVVVAWCTSDDETKGKYIDQLLCLHLIVYFVWTCIMYRHPCTDIVV